MNFVCIGMSVDAVNIKISMQTFLTSFNFYAFMMYAFYHCNLRAYLMSADLEPKVETAQDIYEQVCFKSTLCVHVCR